MASSSPPNPAISPKEQADPAPDSADEKTSAAQPAQEIQKKDAKKVKLRKRRPFGSIRCRSVTLLFFHAATFLHVYIVNRGISQFLWSISQCNSYGVTSQCSCAPTARYSVMIQSKVIIQKVCILPSIFKKPSHRAWTNTRPIYSTACLSGETERNQAIIFCNC